MAQDDLSRIYPQLMADVNIRLIELQVRQSHPGLGLGFRHEALGVLHHLAQHGMVATAGGRELGPVYQASWITPWGGLLLHLTRA